MGDDDLISSLLCNVNCDEDVMHSSMNGEAGVSYSEAMVTLIRSNENWVFTNLTPTTSSMA